MLSALQVVLWSEGCVAAAGPCSLPLAHQHASSACASALHMPGSCQPQTRCFCSPISPGLCCTSQRGAPFVHLPAFFRTAPIACSVLTEALLKSCCIYIHLEVLRCLATAPGHCSISRCLRDEMLGVLVVCIPLCTCILPNRHVWHSQNNHQPL